MSNGEHAVYKAVSGAVSSDLAQRKIWASRVLGEATRLSTGGFHVFDAVTKNGEMVAAFACNRPKTLTGNENTGGVRKALNDLQFLNLLPPTVANRFFVFTDKDFLNLILKRGKRVGTERITFLYCKLPEKLSADLEQVLNLSRQEQVRQRS